MTCDVPSLQAPAARSVDWAERPLALLRSGVPLTLLIDLADRAGPRSELIYDEEVGRLPV